MVPELCRLFRRNHFARSPAARQITEMHCPSKLAFISGRSFAQANGRRIADRAGTHFLLLQARSFWHILAASRGAPQALAPR
jgi:hypothetical protein